MKFFVEISKMNNKRKLLDSIASKLALNESESKADPPKQKSVRENIGPIKQKNDFLKERFAEIV